MTGGTERSRPSRLLKPIRHTLKRLVGKPMWNSRGALDLQFFEFGQKNLRLNRKGQEGVFADYTLFISCAWELTGPRGVVTSSLDRYKDPLPVFPVCNDYGLDWSFKDLKSQRLWYYLYFALDEPPVVRRVEVVSELRFALHMSGGHSLWVELVDTQGEGFDEWSFVKDPPGGKRLLTVRLRSTEQSEAAP